MGLLASTFAFSESADDLFDLSLEDLVTLRIDGHAVRDLQLHGKVHLGTHAELENVQLAASIDLINDKAIAARGLSNIVEVAENMVGILSGESPSEPYSFSMRGFSRDRVKVLYDGINLGTATLNMRPLSTHNIKQVEVIKGPVVLQHGQGASAGTINFVSKQPNAKLGDVTSTSFSAGEFGNTSAGAELNVGFAGGAYRLDVFHRDSSGWVDDADSSTTDLHFSVLFSQSDQHSIRLTYSHLEDDLPAYWGTPLIPENEAQSPSDAVIRNDGLVIDESLRFVNYNVFDHVIESKANWYRVDHEWRISPQLKAKTTGYLYQAERSWRNSESYIYDSGTQQVDRDRLLVEHDRTVYGVKSNFLFQSEWLGRPNKTNLTFELSAIEFERMVGFDQVNFFVDSVDLDNPEPGFFGSVSTRNDFLDERLAAIVVEDWFSLSDRWHLEGGLRLEQVEIDRQRLNFDGSIRQNLEEGFFQSSYRVATGYQITPDAMTYLQYSLQHDNITGDLVNPLVEDVSQFEPSDTKQWEFGYKALLFSANLQMTAAIYSIEKQAKMLVSADESMAVTKSEGLDLSLAQSLTERVKLGVNLSYVDAHYGNYYDLDYDRDVSGNRPVNVPATMASVWATFSRVYQLPIEVGIGTNYVGKRYADSSNETELSAYQLYHAFAAYHVDQYRIMFQVRNITDEVYAPWADIYYTEQALLGPPRRYELIFKARF